jgi:hypothetical protein
VVTGDGGVEGALVAASRLSYWVVAHCTSVGVADALGQVAVGGQAHQRLVVVDRPVAVGVDVVGRSMIPPGPSGRRRWRGPCPRCSARTHRRALGGEVRFDEAEIPGLHQVDGPGPRVGPQSRLVLALGADDLARLEQQRLGIGEVPFGEEVGQDADDVVAELGLVAVDAGVQMVAAAGDLGVDEAAAVGVVE